MSGQDRIVFFVPTEEKQWVQDLVDAAYEKDGIKTSISLYRMLLDAYAKRIGFRARPGSEKDTP